MLLSTVIHYGVSPNWHDQQRIFQLLLLSGSSLFFFLYFPSSLIRRKVFAALLLTLGLGVFSSFLSDNSSWALKEWSVFAGLMLFSFNISVSPEWVRRAAIWGLVVLGGFFCYQFLLSYLAAFVSGLRELNPRVLLSGFSNVRTMGQFQAMLLPLMAALGLYLRETGRFRLSWLVMLLLAIQWCISFALAGRGLWLGFAVAHLALCWIGPVGRRFLIVQLSAAFVGLALYFLLHGCLADLARYRHDPHVRYAQWSVSARRVVARCLGHVRSPSFAWGRAHAFLGGAEQRRCPPAPDAAAVVR
ncbi:hypothetical protein ACUHOV_003093 [Pseudomonas aeruginosa]